MKKSLTSYQEIKQITLFVSTVFSYSRLCWFQISQEERSKVWEMYLKSLHTAIMSKWSSLWNLIKCKNLVYIFYSRSSHYVMGQGIGKLYGLFLYFIICSSLPYFLKLGQCRTGCRIWRRLKYLGTAVVAPLVHSVQTWAYQIGLSKVIPMKVSLSLQG